MQSIKKSFVLVMVAVVALSLFVGCSAPPSDGTIEKEIAEYAAKCIWRIEVPGKDILQIFSGSRIKVAAVEIVARSFKSEEGSVRFVLTGSKTGEGDIRNWYGISRETAAPYLSDSLRFEGEWHFRKYDKGWKVAEYPKELVASFQR